MWLLPQQKQHPLTTKSLVKKEEARLYTMWYHPQPTNSKYSLSILQDLMISTLTSECTQGVTTAAQSDFSHSISKH